MANAFTVSTNMHQVIIQFPGDSLRAPVSIMLNDGQMELLNGMIGSATAADPKPIKKIDNSAPNLLEAAAGHMKDRAATYDQPEGERSMGKTVKAFNTITGRDQEGRESLSEYEGWLLMAVLKMVRSETRSNPHVDSIEDLIAYSALYGEARLKS